jgi:signal peptidase II
MNIKYQLLAAISGAIITADQAVKMHVHTHFKLHESITVIPDLFNLTYVQNRGAAFGMLAESHPVFREIFFLSMPPVAMLIILLILRGVSKADRWMIVSLSMVFGGAIGNYIDRLRFGYVVDFLDFHIADKYVWPAFNIADMAIVCGVAILLFLEFTKTRVAPQAAGANAAEGDKKLSASQGQ